MQSFLEALKIQRWDDHRYYHHSRINQSLHLVSALSFLVAYFTIFTNPVASALIGWLVSMVSRQVGSFLLRAEGLRRRSIRPRHEHKEDIKVGYNLRARSCCWPSGRCRRCCCGSIRRCSGCFREPRATRQFLRHVGQVWLTVGIGALLFRTVQLFFRQDVQTGLVWLTKIITDPFHDVMLYYKAPLYLLRGELIDPMERGVPARLKHLAQHAPPDGLVGQRLGFPPPAIALHAPRPPTGSGR